MSEIYFVRHGDTKLNIQGRIRGNANVPLTPEGVKEIRKVAQELAKEDPKPSLIFSDDMKRTHESAEILATNLRIKVHVMSGLRAWNLGDLTGQKESAVRSQIHDLVKNYDKPAPGGEAYKTFLIRFYRALKQILDSVEKNKATVIVMGHGTTSRAVLALFGKSANGNLDPVDSGEMLELELKDHLWRLES